MDETRVINHLERALELFVSLAGKADDDVGCEGGTIESVVHTVNHPKEIVARILAVHAMQKMVGAALQGEMKMRDDLLVVFHDREQVRSKVAGFETGKAQALETGNSRADCGDKTGQGARRLIWLTTAQGGRLPVGAEEDAGEHDLDMSGIDETARFFKGVFEGFAPQCRTEPGDDAVGTMGVAAVLDF